MGEMAEEVREGDGARGWMGEGDKKKKKCWAAREGSAAAGKESSRRIVERMNVRDEIMQGGERRTAG